MCDSKSALRRIQKEFKDMQERKSAYVYAEPTSDDMFLWHFTIRGTINSDYEGGLYHGLIELPSQYPFKPPKIMLLTPSGRFEVKKDICMSFTDYHPESWQPAWTISNILHGIVSYMPVDEDMAIGAVKVSSADRKKIAKYSHNYKCEICKMSLGEIAKKNLLEPTEEVQKKDIGAFLQQRLEKNKETDKEKEIAKEKKNIQKEEQPFKELSDVSDDPLDEELNHWQDEKIVYIQDQKQKIKRL